MEEKQAQSIKNSLAPRPPIVVVMGHIDHGKTTLLDYIRKANIAAKETGGITQHIGAYEAEYNGHKITFLDTPGHEAFSKMRTRGAKIADIVILVVSADDGVKPQTKEALATIKSANIDFLVAINKIDKPAADIERTKNDLAESGVFLEGRGGGIPFAEISAKEGRGVDKLLETILLMSELQDLKGDPDALAEGVVIESHLDPKRGVTSTLLIRNGILKKGRFVAAGDAMAKIKIFENFSGKSIETAGPSDPARVIGFDKLPPVGAEFQTFASQKEAESSRKAKAGNPPPREAQGQTGAGPAITLGVVIKTDVSGSAEAILHEIEKIKNEKIELNVLRAEAGAVSEDDVKTASASGHPLILAFGALVRPAARDLAEKMSVEIMEFKIIYEIADFLEKRFNELAPPEVEKKILGRAKILKIFPSKGKGQVIGGKVSEGVLKRGADFNLLRRENKIGAGSIENLQSGKINTSEVAEGNEFGALAASKVAIAPGDTLEIIV